MICGFVMAPVSTRYVHNWNNESSSLSGPTILESRSKNPIGYIFEGYDFVVKLPVMIGT